MTTEREHCSPDFRLKPPCEMNTKDLFADIKVASPCQASWNQMTGDHRARFCSRCQKNVYNFSAMTADEINALVREKEGKLCARFYRRSDGTMLTADCPVGWRGLTSRLRGFRLAGAGLLLAALTASVISAGRHDATLPRRAGRLSQLWDETRGTVMEWLGMHPRPMVMG